MSVQRRQLLQILSYAAGAAIALPRHVLAMATKTPVSSTHSQPPAKAADHHASGVTEMEKVAGIGGFFFRAKDPKALGQWYLDHLGIALTPTSHDSPVWEQEAGQTVFTPFPEKTDYFGDASKTWMINFRVHNLQKLVAQLQKAGIEVNVDPDATYGHFARLHDPEGNPIELWQPV